MVVNRATHLLIRLIVLTVEVDAGIGEGVQRRLQGGGRELACIYGSWLKCRSYVSHSLMAIPLFIR